MSDAEAIRVAVHYDFASSLCYVAHRSMARLAPFLEEIGVALDWTPIDLSGLMGWRPGARIAPHRLDDIRSIAAGLGVPIRIPSRWQDSRAACAASLVLGDRDRIHSERREPTLRERVFSAIYEDGRRCDENGFVDGILAAMETEIDEAELERGIARLEDRTIQAARASVTGVPTFMLGEWPFGGIQDEATMRSILSRHAARQRTIV
jgi:2-hydroxychromene-2-carboxylate isomerase